MARYFQTTNMKMRAFGYRTATNTVVQGLGSDILKLSLSRIHNALLKGTLDKSKMALIHTIHDEINFSVKKDYIHQFMDIVPKMMTVKFPDWEIALEVDVSIGNNWAEVFSVDYKDGKFTPNGALIKATEQPTTLKEQIIETSDFDIFTEDLW